MPEIDVTDVLLDPDVAGSSFQVIRRLETVASTGLAVLTSFIVPAIGGVQPSGDNSLDRKPDFSIQNREIEVFTTFPLRGVSELMPGPLGIELTWQPDLVVWDASNYIVSNIDSWVKYGIGWVKATCNQYDYVGPPPIPTRLVYGKTAYGNIDGAAIGGAIPSH